MDINTVRADQVSPLHEVKRPEQVAELVASMNANGWIGRPLIVYGDEPKHYQALTGSHRQAAAIIAEIDIPVVILTDEQLQVLVDSQHWDAYGTIRSEDAEVEMRQAGYDEMADLFGED